MKEFFRKNKKLVAATKGFEPSAFQAGKPTRPCCHIRVLGGTCIKDSSGRERSQGLKANVENAKTARTGVQIEKRYPMPRIAKAIKFKRQLKPSKRHSPNGFGDEFLTFGGKAANA